MQRPDVSVTAALPPTEELVLEVLAARHRLGEQLWTFKTGCGTALRSLQDKGLVEVFHSIVEGTVRARLTDDGRKLVLSGDYTPPCVQETATDLARAVELAGDLIEWSGLRRKIRDREDESEYAWGETLLERYDAIRDDD